MKPLKMLLIRRDNIGDLVCTTPAIAALRAHFPDARLATLRMMLRIRRERYDAVLIATPGYSASAHKFARHVGARRVIAAASDAKGVTDPVSLAGQEGRHEAEQVMALLAPLGIQGTPGPCKMISPAPRTEPRSLRDAPLIGMHLSARKPSQRWPVERYAELARHLHAAHGARFLLFWAPGARNDPRHPGDDEKAEQMMQLGADLPLEPCVTATLPELITGLSRCDAVICADGGAMHLAAGLGKPLVCFFGNSSAEHWHPWGVEYELLQAPSREVADISVEDARLAYERLSGRLR